MARAQVLKSFTLKFQLSNKCFGGNKRERTKRRTTKELQDLDPLGSPHLEERLIGGNMDLDLSLFPQKYARIMGGVEREASFLRSTMVGERGKTCWKKLRSLWGRRGPFIGPHEKEPLQETYPGDSGPPRPDTPAQTGDSGVIPGCLRIGQQSRTTLLTKKQSFRPETPV